MAIVLSRHSDKHASWLLFSKQSCGVALGTFVGIATLTVSQNAFLFCLLFAVWTGALAYHCAFDPPSSFCRFAAFTTTTVAMAGLFQNNPDVNIALIRGAEILLGVLLAAIINLQPNWKEEQKVAKSSPLATQQGRRLARQHAGRVVLAMFAMLVAWLWLDIPAGPFGMVATSVIATPSIDSAAIRFSQRFAGVILGMSLAVVFTAILLPELERIQEFDLWIFGGFWVCSFLNYHPACSITGSLSFRLKTTAEQAISIFMGYLMYLHTFVAVCRSGSITKASKYLNLSQPAVSGQIRMLETQIGRDLFTRTSRGIIPTAAAHELARSSGPHIDALELLGETAQISDYEGTVHLGGPIEFLTERVLPSLSPLIRNGLGFRVTVASPDKLIDQLSKHTIDLAVTGVKITKSGISYDLLYDEKLVLVASPYWANLLPRQAELSASHLAQAPLLAYAEDLPLISDFWDSVFGKGLEERRAAVVAPNWQALMGLAIAGAGITVLPRCYCESELQRGELVELIQPRNPPLNRLYLAYTARNIRMPRNRAVRDTLLKAKAQW